MSYRPYYKKGDWNGICDVCGRKVKASTLRQRWDGLLVCKEDWEPRHPQDFVRGISENVNPPYTRPEVSKDDFFTDPYFCWTRSAVPTFAVPGCMIPNDPSLGPTYAQVFGIVEPSTFIEP